MDIDIRAGEDGAATVITVRGELDVLTAASLRTAVGEVIDDGRVHLVLDATDLDFMDSTGVGVLVIALRRTRVSGGSFAIVGAHGRALRTLSMTGLDRVFTLYGTLEDAEVGERSLAVERP